jgi:hypothetical protein
MFNDISLLWKKLRWRTTSDPDDQTICLATLLDIDVAPLLQMPAENRMKHLVSQLRAFPAHSIFYRGDRLNDDGFSWAPKGILGCSENISPGGPSGHITCYGLEVTFPSFILHAKRTPLNVWFWMVNGDNRSCYRVTFDKSEDRPHNLVVVGKPMPNGQKWCLR